jgi:hypothetical protein
MADLNDIPNQNPNLTIEELEIIGYFARGQKYSFSSKNLKLDSSETSIRLSDREGKLLGISKQINEWQRKVLVSNTSSYKPKILETLKDRGFITKQTSSHPNFTEHHHYKIPGDYKLNYTKILQLWKVWWNNKQYQLQPRTPSIDPLIFTKGNWHRIQQENFLLQTANGEAIICAEDWVIWIDKLEPKPIIQVHQSTAKQDSIQLDPFALAFAKPLPAQKRLHQEIVPANSIKSNMFTQINPPPMTPISPLGLPPKDNTNSITDLPAQDNEDLEYYLNTFNTEDTEDVDRIEGIYNIGELLGDPTSNDRIASPSTKSKPTFKLEVKVVEPAASQPKHTAPVELAASQPKSTAPVVEIPVGRIPSNPQIAPIVPPPPPKSPNLSGEIGRSISEPTTGQSTRVANEASSTTSISAQKKLLKLKVIDTLTKYLTEGECVTHTEVIKNTQGDVINSKTIETQRSCPKWAIDLIQSL